MHRRMLEVATTVTMTLAFASACGAGLPPADPNGPISIAANADYPSTPGAVCGGSVAWSITLVTAKGAQGTATGTSGTSNYGPSGSDCRSSISATGLVRGVWKIGGNTVGFCTVDAESGVIVAFPGCKTTTF